MLKIAARPNNLLLSIKKIKIADAFYFYYAKFHAAWPAPKKANPFRFLEFALYFNFSASLIFHYPFVRFRNSSKFWK